MRVPLRWPIIPGLKYVRQVDVSAFPSDEFHGQPLADIAVHFGGEAA